MSETEVVKSNEVATKIGFVTSTLLNEQDLQLGEGFINEEVAESEPSVRTESDGQGNERQHFIMDDESSSSGFIVIKPNSDVVENNMEIKEDEGHQASNVIYIHNSTELSLEGLDEAVLNQVQRALEESGMEHSIMIVDGDGNSDDSKTSYIIDLNSDDKSHSQNYNVVSECKSSSPSTESTVMPPAPSTSFISKLVTTSLPQDISSNDSLDVQISTSVVEEDTIIMPNREISSKTPASFVAGNSITEKSNKTAHTLSLSLPDNPLSRSPILKNLTHTVSSQDKSNSHPFEEKLMSSPATSHVAEQLLNIAKKMIGDGGSTSQRISVDETMSKIVISPEQNSSREKNSESVITMYLSSPNELKSKLEKFKTDSPVIIVQAGEEPLTEEEDDGDSLENINQENRTSVTKVETMKTASPLGQAETNAQKSIETSITKSDSFVAAFSSLASDSVLYSCSECGYSSHNKHYYKQHVDLVHNEERPYKCPHCDYAGKRRHALLEHMVVHSDQRPYVCSYCNASFRKKGHLTNHIKLHTSQRLVQCGVCNIQLPDSEAFESHLRKIHNTDKLYKCQLCDHTVIDRRAMLNHLATHNENVDFSCPKCPSYFHEKKLLNVHLRDVHGVATKSSEEDVSSSNEPSQVLDRLNSSVSASSASDAKTLQPANVICSECGFICTDPQVMKKHMWVHIDSSSDMNVQIKGQTTSSNASAPPSNAMGVLKMNVVAGLKSLPENVMYQCTSCNFTASDNSVFIKHMLLHKTQRKTHLNAAKSEEETSQNEIVTSEKVPGKTISVLPNPSQLVTSGTVKGKALSNVPFVFDESSGRFRCLICGYHCDYQRTIKAHIWKHSGHQNIEYPVFDQTKKAETTSQSLAPIAASGISPHKPLAASTPSLPPTLSSASTLLPVQQMQLLKTNTGNIVKLMPVDPKSTKYKPGDLIQIKDNAIIVSEKCEKDSPADRFLKTVAVPVKSEDISAQASVTVKAEGKLVIDEGLKLNEGIESSLSKISTLPLPKDPKSLFLKAEPLGQRDHERETCKESNPNVVVEIVDTVPSGLGLTGLNSQQGSPRVSDLESSGGELKLSAAFKDALPSEKPSISSSTQPDDQETGKRKYNLRKPKDLKKVKRLTHSQGENDTSEMVTARKRVAEPIESRRAELGLKQESISVKPEVFEQMEISNAGGVESDTTESSDEIGSAGESGSSSNPPKTGICSSLLAVIEQLRERSRSESEKSTSPTKDISKKIARREKKPSGNTETTAPLSEFHNIERINVDDGEKYRCSLCHYTSQRICNMKIHMKTHRQKKPSECSLCDFSSSVPGALQEHVLQHCKVRTYSCKFCPQIFNHKSTLRAHMRAHKDKEPYLCAYCVFEASTPTELKEHMQVHSGCSSRLRCPSCDHIVNNKEELTSHLMKCSGKVEHTSTLPMPDPAIRQTDMTAPKSQESGGSGHESETDAIESFPEAEACSTGPSVATEHACVVSGCSYTSYSVKELQEHLSIHCNPSLLVCDLCDFKALHNRSLKSHMKRHANDQRYVQQPLEQYKCNLCGYVCHHLPSLKSHMWRHASDQSYSYEFTNDVINAAIDHDSRVDANAGEADDPELLDRVINSERRIMEGELTKSGQGDGQRPTCWVTFRCCSCGFETINKAKLNIHMRSHSDIIKQTLDGVTRKPGQDKSNYSMAVALAVNSKSPNKRIVDTVENDEPFIPPKVKKVI